MAVNPSVSNADPGAAPPVSSSSWRLALDLLFMLTSRELLIRYKQSVMGFLWALLLPLLVVLAGVVIRAAMARINGVELAHDAIAAILVKSLPWAFFVSALRQSTTSLTSNSNLVTRARCPRIVFPLSAVLSSLVDFCVAAVPLIAVLIFVGVPLSPHLLWSLPLLLLLVILVTGLGVALATANLFFRDVKYIVEVVLMFAIFFTPVLFEAGMLGEWRNWILLNPVAPLLEGFYSAVVLARTPDLPWLAYSAVVAIMVSIGAWFLFRRFEPIFADCI